MQAQWSAVQPLSSASSTSAPRSSSRHRAASCAALPARSGMDCSEVNTRAACQTSPPPPAPPRLLPDCRLGALPGREPLQLVGEVEGLAEHAHVRVLDLAEVVGVADDEDLPAALVEDLAGFDFTRAQIGLFSAGGSVSEKYAPIAAQAGAIVIDNTSAFRYVDEIPLVVPEVNPHMLEDIEPGAIIANPNCSTIQMVVALKPLHDEARLRHRRIVLLAILAAGDAHAAWPSHDLGIAFSRNEHGQEAVFRPGGRQARLC